MWRDLKNFHFYTQNVARPHRLQPAAFLNTRTAGGFRLVQQMLGAKAHGDGARLPAGCGKPAQQRSICSLLIEVMRLRVELARKLKDVVLRHFVVAECESLAGVKILEINGMTHVLNRKCITSPSCTTYSFPSRRNLPASRAPASPFNNT